MLLIESYLVRRLLVGRASQGLNRQLANLANQLYENRSSEPADVAVHTYLTRQVRQYVTDQALRDAARTAAFYYAGRGNQRKQVLLWLEELFGSQNVSILKICPSNTLCRRPYHRSGVSISETDYDEEVIDEQHASLVHTLGNLTLTGYNPPQSNRPFEEKRAYLCGTSLKMSQEIGRESKWTFEEVQNRTARLIEMAIDRWPGPLDDISA